MLLVAHQQDIAGSITVILPDCIPDDFSFRLILAAECANNGAESLRSFVPAKTLAMISEMINRDYQVVIDCCSHRNWSDFNSYWSYRNHFYAKEKIVEEY